MRSRIDEAVEAIQVIRPFADPNVPVTGDLLGQLRSLDWPTILGHLEYLEANLPTGMSRSLLKFESGGSSLLVVNEW